MKLYHRTYAAEEGYQPGPETVAFMVCCLVADTDEKAQEEGKHFLWRMGHPLRGPREYFAPPGYVTPMGNQLRARARPTPLNQLSYSELQERDHLIVGSPDTVTRKLKHIKDQLGIGSLLLEAQAGRLSHEATMRSIELLGREVIPALKEV